MTIAKANNENLGELNHQLITEIKLIEEEQKDLAL